LESAKAEVIAEQTTHVVEHAQVVEETKDVVAETHENKREKRPKREREPRPEGERKRGGKRGDRGGKQMVYQARPKNDDEAVQVE
jgi:hypothetical protein